jgi:segregation and condensation protein B
MSITEDPLVVLEGLLLTSDQPLSLSQLRLCFDKRYTKPEIARLLVLLQERWEGRALELKEVADGLWRFQSVAEVRDILRKLHPEEAPKYTRTVMETLAVIAYRQPVTRGDIEKIRGVTVNPQAIRTLLDRNWIEVIGRRETIGHPELFATTRQFLLDLGLNSLQDLPSLSETAPEEAEAFELFEGQYDREEELRQHRLLDSPLLAAIDAEHARLESLAKAVLLEKNE